MKKFFLKMFYIFTFILFFVGNCFAADLNISSVTYDDSGTFLLINSFDNENIQIPSPKLNIIADENKAYFDINNAFISCPPQNIFISSRDINEVNVNQISTEPNIVRVAIKYNQEFNPKNIQLKRVANTFVVRFRTTQIQNYYFQHIYSDAASLVQDFFEPIVIQKPVPTVKTVANQINSAFGVSASGGGDDFVLAKKDLVLPTLYYLDDLVIRNGIVHISGVGSLTLAKPFTLSEPSRVVYDIPNAILNPTLRNREFSITSTDFVKLGQFDTKTVRLVISTDDTERYIPVFSSDNQNFVFMDKSAVGLPFRYASSGLRSITAEKKDDNITFLKFVFSKPIEYSVQRKSDKFELSLLNVEKLHEINLKSLSIPKDTSLTQNPKGGLVFSIPLAAEDNVTDVHAGADGKTLRLKLKLTKPVEIQGENVQPPKVDHKGKIYVVIDPGHGGSDCGAIRKGINEKDITLDISKRVEGLLSKKGYEVFMTRMSDETVSLQERVEISENLQPDIFVSIHVNSSNSSAPNGLETHYYKDNSLQLAKTLHASLLNHVNAADRGLFKSKFYVINHTTAPAVLVEVGFMSNDAERVQLLTESRKQATAKAIVEGINDYFKK